MMSILHEEGIMTNLEKEGPGCFEDSVLAVMTASFLHMSSDVGFFQVEEVLLQKVVSSPAKDFIELYAGVEGSDLKRYL